MDKKDWIWVAIRIFGIYLVVMGIVGVPKMIGSGIIASFLYDDYQYYEDASSDVDTSDTFEKGVAELHKSTFERALSDLILGLTRVILFLGCGIYFLRGGKRIFKLVNYEHTPETES